MALNSNNFDLQIYLYSVMVIAQSVIISSLDLLEQIDFDYSIFYKSFLHLYRSSFSLGLVENLFHSHC